MKPAFCTVCGKKLKAAARNLEAFDPYTGKPVSVEALECPERKGEAKHVHDRWEKNPDNAAAEWERWDG